MSKAGVSGQRGTVTVTAYSGRRMPLICSKMVANMFMAILPANKQSNLTTRPRGPTPNLPTATERFKILSGRWRRPVPHMVQASDPAPQSMQGRFARVWLRMNSSIHRRRVQ